MFFFEFKKKRILIKNENGLIGNTKNQSTMTMQIVVKLLTNKTTMILNCNSASTGAEIKDEIQKKWNIHPKDQRLIFGRGKILSHDSILKTIPELNGIDNIIHLVIRLP